MGFWDLWYFNIPNYLLAAVFYTLLGRLLLTLFVPPNWDNYIWRNFCRLTDPVIAGVRLVTPQIVPMLFLLPLTLVWLHLLRVALAVLLAPIAGAPAAGAGG